MNKMNFLLLFMKNFSSRHISEQDRSVLYTIFGVDNSIHIIIHEVLTFSTTYGDEFMKFYLKTLCISDNYFHDQASFILITRLSVRLKSEVVAEEKRFGSLHKAVVDLLLLRFRHFAEYVRFSFSK